MNILAHFTPFYNSAHSQGQSTILIKKSFKRSKRKFGNIGRKDKGG